MSKIKEKEYMLLVERIRRYTKNMPLNEAVETAVNECIEENILADFLQKTNRRRLLCVYLNMMTNGRKN